jgi:hypothetical protein
VGETPRIHAIGTNWRLVIRAFSGGEREARGVRSRFDGDVFTVAPGHVYPDVERVVETDGLGNRYEVVEKFGEAGALAVALDSRT